MAWGEIVTQTYRVYHADGTHADRYSEKYRQQQETDKWKKTQWGNAKQNAKRNTQPKQNAVRKNKKSNTHKAEIGKDNAIHKRARKPAKREIANNSRQSHSDTWKPEHRYAIIKKYNRRTR